MSSSSTGAGRSFLLACDAFADGRRLRLLSGLALLQTLVAPLMDADLGAVARLADFKGAAKAAGSINYAGMSVFSLLSAMALILVLGLVVGGRAAALSSPDGVGEAAISFGRALRSLFRIVRVELRLLLRRSRLEAIGLVGLVAYAALQSLRSVLAIGRYFAWALVEVLGAEDTVFGDAVVAVYSFEGLLALVALVALFGFGLVVAVWMMQREGSTEGLAGHLREVRALRAEHPLVNLRDANRRNALAEHFHGDLVAAVLNLLAAWTPPPSADCEADIHDDIVRCLREAGFSVASERWLPGRRRVDITVNDRLALELKWVASSVTERDRACSQLREYARVWTDRGPVLLVAVNVRPEHLTPFADAAREWNASFVEPHAPILVLSLNSGS